MSGLTPCATCHRHIEIPHGPSGLERESAVCPFCGARARFTFAPPMAAWSLALGLVAAACSESESNDDDTAVGSTTDGPTSGPGATSTSQGASVTDTFEAGGEDYAGPDPLSETSSWATTVAPESSSEVGALESETSESSSSESGSGSGSSETGTGESTESSTTDEPANDYAGPPPKP